MMQWVDLGDRREGCCVGHTVLAWLFESLVRDGARPAVCHQLPPVCWSAARTVHNIYAPPAAVMAERHHLLSSALQDVVTPLSIIKAVERLGVDAPVSGSRVRSPKWTPLIRTGNSAALSRRVRAGCAW